MEKEEHIIKGVVKNQPDSFDKYEDVVDGIIKKEIKDQSPSIEELIDEEVIKVEEDNDIEYEHIGPEAHKYNGMSAEEIDEQIHKQLKSQYPDQYPEYLNPDMEGLRDAIGKAYEQDEARYHEPMNQRYREEKWLEVPFQTKDKGGTVYGGHAGRDNLKTLTENKKSRSLRELVRRLFKTEPELITEEEYPSFEELVEESDNTDVEKITKGVLSKEELKKEESEQDKAA